MKFENSALHKKCNDNWNKVTVPAHDNILKILIPARRHSFMKPQKEAFEQYINTYYDSVNEILRQVYSQLELCSDSEYVESYINEVTVQALRDLEKYKSEARQWGKLQSIFMQEIIDDRIERLTTSATISLSFEGVF